MVECVVNVSVVISGFRQKLKQLIAYLANALILVNDYGGVNIFSILSQANPCVLAHNNGELYFT